MSEINLITVRHADGREIQYVQFDKLAIGQVLNEGKESEIHYAFQTHIDTRTEYIKLDALLRELGFVEVARTQVPFEFGEKFNELNFLTYEISTLKERYTAYAFKNIVVITGDNGMSVHTNIRVDEVFYKWFGYSFDSHVKVHTNIPNDAATALAFRIIDMEYKFYDKMRAPGEEFDIECHEGRLQEVINMRQSIIDGSLNINLMRLSSAFDSFLEEYPDLEYLAQVTQIAEVLQELYPRFLEYQQKKLAELLTEIDKIQ